MPKIRKYIQLSEWRANQNFPAIARSTEKANGIRNHVSNKRDREKKKAIPDGSVSHVKY